MLTNRALKVLEEMAEAESRGDYAECEIVCDGAICWLGITRIHRRTIMNLIQHVAISLVSEPGSLERYMITGTGRAILQDPDVGEKVRMNLLKGINCDASGNPI